jgi:hypothetical protein
VTPNVGQPPSAVQADDSRGRLSSKKEIAQLIRSRFLGAGRHPLDSTSTSFASRRSAANQCLISRTAQGKFVVKVRPTALNSRAKDAGVQKEDWYAGGHDLASGRSDARHGGQAPRR